MSILKIARLGHPVLIKKAKPVINITGDEVKKIILDMTETMLDAKGIGLAAPQVHINKQIIVFRTLEEEERDENIDNIKVMALINPKFIKMSDEIEDEWEGCLSIPGMLGLVKRYKKIKYEGYDIKGNYIEREVEGLHARVVQHEFDHLMGIMYISRLVNKNSYGFTEEIDEYHKKNNII